VNNHDNNALPELLPCPACEGTAITVVREGNDKSKRRKVTIKCLSCRIERSDAAMRKDMAWLERTAIENWNRRSSGEDDYVIEQMGRLLAEIAVIVNGPEPEATRWSYHDLPEKVRELCRRAAGREEAVACEHENTNVEYDSVTCNDCGKFRTDSQWGVARCKWFNNRAEAEFFRKNGFLPDARPTAPAGNGGDSPDLDRIEFALRDAGFDYDLAFRIAHMATTRQVGEFYDEWLRTLAKKPEE
jgi:hypothetical protein